MTPSAAPSPTLYILGGLLLAVVTATGAYLVARRQTSGTVRTSEAEDLWNEGQTLRKDMREEIVRQGAEVTLLRDRVCVLEELVAALRAELDSRPRRGRA